MKKTYLFLSGIRKASFLLILLMMLVPIIGSAQTNIAPQAVVTAMGTTIAGCQTGACSTVNDLNLGACGTQQMWINTNANVPTGTEWIQFDFSFPKSMDEIIIHHGDNTGRFLSGGLIQFWDGNNWITQHHFTNLPMACISSISFPKMITARFRITGFEMTTSGQLSNPNFREIEVISAPTAFNDAMVLSVDSPVTFCAGANDIYATIGNYGLNQINSVEVHWEVNGMIMPVIYYGQLLDTLNGNFPNTAQILLGNANLNAGFNSIRVFTRNPNGAIDQFPTNDTVEVIIQSASAPSNGLAFQNIGLSSVDAYVLDGTGNYDYEYGLSGYTQGTGTMGSISSDMFSLSGLSHSTSYDVYLRSDCGGGDVSAWVGPFIFYTAAATPFFQDFENFGTNTAGIANIEGWNTKSTADPQWQTGTSTPSAATGPIVDHTIGTGGTFTYLETNGGGQGSLDSLISPPIYIDSNITSLTIEFWYHMHGSTMGDLEVYIDTNGVTEALDTIVGQQQALQTDPWSFYSKQLSGFEGSTIKLIFIGIRGNGTTGDMAIDDIRVMQTPSCLRPSDLASANATLTSADISWTENNLATQWEIEFDTAGFTFGTGTRSRVTSNPFTLSGLNNGPYFEFYVRSVCGRGDSSIWSGPFKFSTLTYSVTTAPPLVNNNSSGGISFNVGADIDLTITEIMSMFTGTTSYTIWYHTDSINGQPTITTANGWIQHQSGTAAGVAGVQISMPLSTPIDMNAGDVYGFHIQANTAYQTLGAGPTVFTDGNLYINTGTNVGWGGPAPNPPNHVRQFLGTVVYEPMIKSNDNAATESVDSLLAICAGPQDVYASISNAGINKIDSVEVHWEVNGVAQPMVHYKQMLDTANSTFPSSATILLGTANMIAGSNTINVWTAMPNGVVDTVTANDTASLTIFSPSAPTSVNLTNITPSSVDVEVIGVAGTIEYEYGTLGFVLGNGTSGSSATNPFTVSGLNSSTGYDIYVRNNCGGTSTSAWSGPYYFETPCVAVTAFPILEPFNSFLPNCWEEATAGTPLTGPSSFGASDWINSDFMNDASLGTATKINLYFNNDEEWLFSPIYDLSVGGPYELRVDAALTPWLGTTQGTFGTDDEVQVLVSTNGGTSWNNLYTWNASNTPVNTAPKVTIDLTAYTGANNMFAIWATDGLVDDPEDNDFHIDNFEIRETPTCIEPSNLTANNITRTAAELSWTENNSATEWEIEYGTSGFPQGNGNKTLVTTNPFTIGGLQDGTAYQFYVRSICTAGDTSYWSGPFEFVTLYPPTKGGMIPLPGFGSTYTGTTRGYWFTAPTDFIITGLRVPTDIGLDDQNIHLVRFNAPPPAYAATTTSFTTLGYWTGVPGATIVGANIAVNQGDVIGVLGTRGTNSTNSYATPAGPFQSTILGQPVTLTRLLYQGAIHLSPAPEFSEEVAGSIARVEIYHTPPASGSNNAATVSVDSLMGFCAGPQDVYATIKNGGINQIDSVEVHWEVNGILQPMVHSTQLLDTFGGSFPTEASILLGTANMISGNNTVKVWTSLPNGVADTLNGNDTVNAVLFTPSAPTDVQFSNIGFSSATVEVIGAFGTIQYEYGPTNFALGSGVSGISASNPFNIGGLSNGPNFDFYARSICGPGDTSAWAGPFSFRTLTYSVTTTPPLVNNNGSGGVTFNVGAHEDLKVTEIMNLFNAGSVPYTIWYNTDSINGQPNITTATGWIQYQTGTVNGITNVQTSVQLNTPIEMKAGDVFGFHIQANLAYQTYASGPAVFTDGNLHINTGNNVGYGGPAPNPPNHPRQFLGTVVYELSPKSNDNAGVESIDSLLAICAGTQDVYATVVNDGINQIDSVEVNWEVNGVLQPMVHYKQLLDTMSGTFPTSASILLGTANMLSGNNTVKVWTSLPNGVADTINNNDTVIVNLFSPSDPTGLTFSNVTTTSFDAEVIGTAGTLDYEYGIKGFTLGTGSLGSSVTNTFTASNLSSSTEYDVYVRNNCGASSSAWVGPFTVRTAIAIPYVQDFQNFGSRTTGIVDVEGWNSVTTADPQWQSGTATPSTATGPVADHTVGAGGTFMYLETSGGSLGSFDSLISPPIYFDSSYTNVVFEFWYHMHGADMGEMEVYIDTNGVSNLITTNIGQTHPAQTDPWTQFTTQLLGYEGSTVRLIFKGIRGNGLTSDMAIDDVSLTVLAPIDGALSGMSSPISQSCFTSSENVVVELVNTGLNSLDFTVDSTLVTVNMTGANTQSISFMVNNNSLNSNSPLLPMDTISIPVGTVDMTNPGTYYFDAVLSGTNDGVVDNNTFKDTLEGSRTGSLFGAASLCTGDSATLFITGHRGSVQWQMNTGSGFVDIVGANSNKVKVGPTSSTDYRAVVCGTLYSDTTSLNPVTPSMPFATDSSMTVICGNSGIVAVTATSTNPNAKFEWYTNPTGGDALKVGGSIFGISQYGDTLHYLGNPSQSVPSIDTFYVQEVILSGSGICASPRDTSIANVDCLVDIEESSEVVSNISIHPNPSRGAFSIVGKDVRNEIQISLYNSNGKLVYQSSDKLSNNFEERIDISGLAKGLYFVKLQSDSSTETLKVVVQ